MRNVDSTQPNRATLETIESKSMISPKPNLSDIAPKIQKYGSVNNISQIRSNAYVYGAFNIFTISHLGIDCYFFSIPDFMISTFDI